MAPVITMPVLKAAGVVAVLWWLARKASAAPGGGGGIDIVVECDPDADLINPQARKNCEGDAASGQVEL